MILKNRSGHKVYSAEWIKEKMLQVTGKNNVPKAVRKEIEVTFVYEIVSEVEKHKISITIYSN